MNILESMLGLKPKHPGLLYVRNTCNPGRKKLQRDCKRVMAGYIPAPCRLKIPPAKGFELDFYQRLGLGLR